MPSLYSHLTAELGHWWLLQCYLSAVGAGADTDLIVSIGTCKVWLHPYIPTWWCRWLLVLPLWVPVPILILSIINILTHVMLPPSVVPSLYSHLMVPMVVSVTSVGAGANVTSTLPLWVPVLILIYNYSINILAHVMLPPSVVLSLYSHLVVPVPMLPLLCLSGCRCRYWYMIIVSTYWHM